MPRLTAFARYLQQLALLAAAGLSGCASPQLSQLRQHPPPDLPPQVELADVPFYPQQDYQCGPAAQATVLDYSGAAADPVRLVDEVYLPRRRGALQPEMLATARRHGRLAYPMLPTVDALLREVAAGTPVVVLQNLGWRIAPTWHYAVVIGYDLPGEQVILRSGVTRRQTLSLDAFMRSWAAGGQWAMLALPPDRLPASASEAGYVQAAVALERLNPRAARSAYTVALARWPDSLSARLGQGNAAYAQHDLDAAEAAYRRATLDHPDAADAWNNLAQVLLEQGRRDDARRAAEQAIALGGPRHSVYEQTLQSVLNATPR